jgi:hypothetical protein
MGLAIQAKLPWTLDLYFALEGNERWFFGFGAEGGAWGNSLGGALYAVATHYFYEQLYVTFTPRVALTDERAPGESPRENVVWFNPQLALGVARPVDISVFVSHGRLTGVGYDNTEAFSLPEHRKSFWMIGAEARFSSGSF